MSAFYFYVMYNNYRGILRATLSDNALAWVLEVFLQSLHATRI